MRNSMGLLLVAMLLVSCGSSVPWPLARAVDAGRRARRKAGDGDPRGSISGTHGASPKYGL